MPQRHIPQRTCVACRSERPKREMVRIVRAPDGAVSVDPTGKRSGRGAYLCREGDCRKNATQRGGLARALRTPLPPELQAALAGEAMMMNEGGARGQE